MTFLVYAALSGSLSDNSQEIDFDGYLPRVTEAVYRTLNVEVHPSTSIGDPARCAACRREDGTQD